MTGTNNPGAIVPTTGINGVDALTLTKWTETTVYYSFSANTSNYGSYPASPNRVGELSTFSPVTAATKNAANFALDGLWAGSKGFSVEGFTNLNVVLQAAPSSGLSPSHIRYGQTAMTGSSEGGYTNLPGTALSSANPTQIRNGDIWLNDGMYTDVRPGTVAWYSVLHETGHALGLKHTWEVYSSISGHPALVQKYDGMEFTVMTYSSFPGENALSVGGNGQFDYPQTFMMFDILALQYTYGADFTTNNTNTIYKWNPSNGDTYVNGQIAIDAPTNKIFATIWDGGGIDTYDFSAYTTGLKIDLRPGGASVLSTTQLANLGSGHVANGNVYNALQYKGDAKSLIENAKGGAGGDSMIGNQAANVLYGNGGSDAFNGLGGNDIYVGGAGSDSFIFVGSGGGRDTAYDFDSSSAGDVVYLKGSTTLHNYAEVKAHLFQVGSDVELRDTDGDILVLKNTTLAQLDASDFYFG